MRELEKNVKRNLAGNQALIHTVHGETLVPFCYNPFFLSKTGQGMFHNMVVFFI